MIAGSAMSVPRDFFPAKPSQSALEDIVAAGGELEFDFLYEAYSRGIFPWPHEGYPLLWFFPSQRGVILRENFHVPKSLKKVARKKNWQLTWNQNFSEIIGHCQSQTRPGQKGTWITEELKAAYNDFHKKGYAKSLEVWEGNRCVGGIYGVFIEGHFSAESMFYFEPNASKYALWSLCEFLFSLKLSSVDVQMVTSVSAQFGAELISANEFEQNLELQKQAWKKSHSFESPGWDQKLFSDWFEKRKV